MEGASRTAIVTAQFRAAHALVDRDPIFQDRFALALAGCSAAEVTEFLAANAPDSCAHVVRLFVCQRSRFVEQEVARRRQRCGPVRGSGCRAELVCLPPARSAGRAGPVRGRPPGHAGMETRTVAGLGARLSAEPAV